MSDLFTLSGAAVDRAALWIMERMWLSGGDPEGAGILERNRRAFELYAAPDLLASPRHFFPRPPAIEIEAAPVGRLSGGRIERVRWPSGYRTFDPTYQEAFDAYEANKNASVEWFRHDRPPKATIICLHAWATGHYLLQRWVFFARRLFASGFDVILKMMPFHGPRTPKGSLFGGQLFPGTDAQRTNEAFGQLIWDTRALVGYLADKGAGALGVAGMSIGGYSAAILASVEERLAFSIPMIPMVSFGDLLWDHGRDHPKRRSVEARGITRERLVDLYGVHCPLRLSPALERDRLMIVAGRGDRIAPPDHVLRLWEHWNRPEIQWFPGGHIAHFGRGKVFEAIRRFIERWV